MLVTPNFYFILLTDVAKKPGLAPLALYSCLCHAPDRGGGAVHDLLTDVQETEDASLRHIVRPHARHCYHRVYL